MNGNSETEKMIDYKQKWGGKWKGLLQQIEDLDYENGKNNSKETLP